MLMANFSNKLHCVQMEVTGKYAYDKGKHQSITLCG